MPPALVNSTLAEPYPESPSQVLAAYHAHQERTGRGNTAATYWAKTFLRRWPQGPPPGTWTQGLITQRLAA